MADSTAVATKPLLSVDGLKVHFFTEDGVARAVDGVSFDVGERETFCLVGESGCGKSVTALSIMGLVPSPPGQIVAGSIQLQNQELVGLPSGEMRKIRGDRVSMIFQEPMTALNPVFTVGNQVMEGIRLHRDVGKREARAIALEMFERVRIPEPNQRLDAYPHQLSGGMKQRVMIAIALACRPDLLIADEPTTALDVTIQAQILELIDSLMDEFGMSTMMITHDLGVVAEVADHVAVMYAGRIVEYSDVKSIFHNPLHPYMVSLFRSLPSLGAASKRLAVIPGNVPDPRRHPSGCRFHPRCPRVMDKCREVEPQLQQVQPGHLVACLRVEP